MNRRTRPYLALIGILAWAIHPAPASGAPQQRTEEGPTPTLRLERGRYLEDAVGDLDAAIQVYRALVEDTAASRAVRAKACFRLGLACRKRGVEWQNFALAAFEQLLTEFPDQRQFAMRSRQEIAAIVGLMCREIPQDIGTLSPSERYDCYTDWDTGNLVVLDRDSGEHVRLTEEGTWEGLDRWADEPLWAPDSDQIAYFWYAEGAPAELRVIRRSDPRPRVLFQGRGGLSLHGWSADGRQLLVAHRPPEGSRVQMLITVADGSHRVIEPTPASGPLRQDLAPDAAWIASDQPQRDGALARDLFVQSTHGGSTTRVMEHQADDHSPLWTPDGQWLLFLSDRSGVTALWALPMDGGVPVGAAERVPPNLGSARPSRFMDDGSLLYSSPALNSDLWVVAVDPVVGRLDGEPVLLDSAFVGINGAPAWSPDGRWLAYLSTRANPIGGSQSTCLVLHELQTGAERILTPPELPLPNWSLAALVSTPRWSPDGREILAGRQIDGKASLVFLDAERGSVIREWQGPSPLRGAVWSQDGDAVFYSQDDVLWRRSVSADAAEPLLRKGGIALGMHPDGRTVTMARAKEILAVPVDGSTPRVIHRADEAAPLAQFAGIDWDPEGRHLFFATKVGDQQEAWILPADGGAPRRLGLIRRNLSVMRVSPNGRSLAFRAVGPDHSSLWKAENLLQVLKERR